MISEPGIPVQRQAFVPNFTGDEQTDAVLVEVLTLNDRILRNADAAGTRMRALSDRFEPLLGSALEPASVRAARLRDLAAALEMLAEELRDRADALSTGEPC